MLNYINNLNCEIARPDLLRHFQKMKQYCPPEYVRGKIDFIYDCELGTNQKAIKWLRDNNKIKSRETPKAPFKIMLNKL
jgi:hypothetical protein